MPTRIAFSTTFPDRMGDLAGKPTRFPEKIVNGLFRSGMDWKVLMEVAYPAIENLDKLTAAVGHPKTTTIRKNYEYWKSKEGQLIQPFFWAGKPRKSKQVVFCPAVLLKRVGRIEISSVYVNYFEGEKRRISMISIGNKDDNGWTHLSRHNDTQFIQNEGFDHPDHFWMWFDKDCDGALLELESVKL